MSRWTLANEKLNFGVFHLCRDSEVRHKGRSEYDVTITGNRNGGIPPMLAEKFFLILETLISHVTDTAQYPDGGPKVVSRARHVPIKLPEIR